MNPVRPWQDRFGTWHSDLSEFDPEESIRSIRRAAVGGLVIRIEPTGDQFRVVTVDHTGDLVRESTSISDLKSATDTAIEHIRFAQSHAQ